MGRTRREILVRVRVGNVLGFSLGPICLPALQVAEIQKIELAVIFSMVDGVYILGEVEPAHTHSPPFLCLLPLDPTWDSLLGSSPTYPLHFFTAVQPIVVTQGSVGLREATCGVTDGLAS